MTAASLSSSSPAALAADYAAALDWWREAGVDLDFADEPQGWLRASEAEAEVEAEPGQPERAEGPPPRTVPRGLAGPGAAPALERALASAPRPAIGGDPAHWPRDLAAFRAFWLTEPSLDPSLADRVAPVGEAGAELLLLVGQPEEGDREALLSGELGTLVERMLRAMGIAQDRAYLASALPRCTPVPEWEDLAARGLAALTCHHLSLAAPRRVLVFGKGPAMLARDCGLPMLAAPQLETLARSPAHKRKFWTRWLEWSA